MRVTLLATAVAAAACGGTSTDLEGIYTIDAWNENPASCADPGPSELANHDPLVFINLDSFFGQDFLAVVECPDVATCTAEATDDDPDFFGTFVFDKGSDSKGWTGSVSYAFPPDANNNCTGGVYNHFLTVDADASGVTTRTEEIDVPSFAPRDGMCEPEDAVEASEGLACTRLEVMHATFMAAF